MYQIEVVKGYVREAIESLSIKYPPSVLIEREFDTFKVIVVLRCREDDGSRFLLRKAIRDRIGKTYKHKVLVFYEYQGE